MYSTKTILWYVFYPSDLFQLKHLMNRIFLPVTSHFNRKQPVRNIFTFTHTDALSVKYFIYVTFPTYPGMFIICQTEKWKKIKDAYKKVDRSRYIFYLPCFGWTLDTGCGGCGHNITGGHHTVTADRKCHETCHECHVPGEE